MTQTLILGHSNTPILADFEYSTFTEAKLLDHSTARRINCISSSLIGVFLLK
jgi:hypothetical protein